MITRIAIYRDCLHDHIMASTDADVLCPCNDQFACGGSITEAEMREVQHRPLYNLIHCLYPI